ncbi:MAG: lipoprotein-releasing ABC transporter permease subunit [Deltaproteobacteria bacterium]|nr:lipoprotein-releasing ABC transporter permease subunit [Deltaproteobacteria bacterium]
MSGSFEFFIAGRYLRAKRKQAFVSLITLISIAGVAIGVMALILVLGVMTGFTDDLLEKILGANSHIVVTGYGAGLENYDQTCGALEQVSGVAAATPFILTQVMLSSETNISGAVLQGIDPHGAARVISIESNLRSGSLDDLGAQHTHEDLELPGIIVGSELAKTLGVAPGRTVTVISPTGLLSPSGMVPRWKKFLVVGLFESGMYEYDNGMAYISLEAAQQFLKMPAQASGIWIRLFDVHNSLPVADAIRAVLSPQYNVRDWKEMHRNLYAALKLEKTAMFIILVLIIVVAAFSIVATLVMMVNEKNREIAILKSMGATAGGIMKIFMIQGLVIGTIGTLLGLSAGCTLAWLQNTYEFIKLAGDVYYIPSLTVKIGVWDTLLVTVCAIGISFLATIYPALQAARLEPVEALRYE